MTITDIIPIIETLSHADKLKLLREKVYLYKSDFLRRTILCGILWVWQRGKMRMWRDTTMNISMM